MDLLPESISGDLALLSSFSDGAFKKLVKGAFGVLLGSTEETAVTGDAELGGDPVDLKRVFTALTSAILEAARADLDEASFVRVLEDSGVLSERAAAAGQGFAKYCSSLRSELSTTTFGCPRIVGVDWRIDYVVKSRHLEKNYRPGYLVTLHTLDAQDQPKDITMSCSVEELTDLVGHLRDATKQVARIVKSHHE